MKKKIFVFVRVLFSSLICFLIIYFVTMGFGDDDYIERFSVYQFALVLVTSVDECGVDFNTSNNCLKKGEKIKEYKNAGINFDIISKNAILVFDEKNVWRSVLVKRE